MKNNGIAGAVAGPHPERDSQNSVALYVTLTPQDADFLRSALQAPPPARRDGLGIKETPGLAWLAVGAVCRSIIEGGYRPKPLYAELREQDLLTRVETLPPGVVKIQLL
jgi:hypothetical protein